MTVFVHAGKRYFINTTAFTSACNYTVNFKQLNKMGVKKKKTQTNNECHNWPVALKHDLFASGQVALSKMMGKKRIVVIKEINCPWAQVTAAWDMKK